MHILCTICSDLVNQAENIHVTKCGHIFHYHCLTQWIERSKSCPQCRHKVTERCMFRLYPTISNELNADDAATLQSRLDDATLQLRSNKATIKEMDDKLSELNVEIKRSTDLIKSYERKLASRESAVTALKEQVDYLKIQNKETNTLKEENEKLLKKIQILNGLQKVLNESDDEVETMLKSYPDNKTIVMFATALKRALCESEAKKNEFRDRLHTTKQQLAVQEGLVANLQSTIMQLNDRIQNCKRKYEALQNKRKASDIMDRSVREEPAKQARLSDHCDLDTAMLDISAKDMSTMVHRIENADSPYLNLKQSSMAHVLSAVQRTDLPDNGIKPSEFAIINSARSHALKSSENVPLSIFHKKQPLKPEPVKPVQLDVSYDGLGGHSKLDTFPTPKCVPKISAKHRLKRPPAARGSQDIGKLLQKMSQ